MPMNALYKLMNNSEKEGCPENAESIIKKNINMVIMRFFQP